MNELVSVIVPVYNTERYLERCVSSIQRQTYRQLEIILVDDGSQDHAGEICDMLANADKRIHVIHKQNGGAASARNAGMGWAHGTYLTFVDSDDFLMDETIYERSVRNIQTKHTDVVAFLWQFQNIEGNYLIKKERTPSNFSEIKTTVEFVQYLYQGSYCNGLVVSVWNKIYHRDFIIGNPFDESLRVAEDDDWANKVYSRLGTVFCDDTFGYTYVQNNESLTHRAFDAANLRFLDIIKERVILFGDDPFLLRESKKLYLNLYIEYYFKAEEAGITPYSDRGTYQKYLSSLGLGGGIGPKTFLRFLLFLISPRVYKKIT